MSDMELKHCDLIQFSKMCAPEYDMPEFSDRILVFDVMQNDWQSASLHNLVQSSAVTKLNITLPQTLPEIIGGKRSLDLTDEEPEPKQIKKVKPGTETKVELLREKNASEIELRWLPTVFVKKCIVAVKTVSFPHLSL